MTESKQSRGPLLAIALSFLLMAVSFAELLPQFGFIFSGDKVLASVVDSSLLGTKLGNQILWFIAAQFLLYLAFGLLLWLVARATVVVFPNGKNPFRTLVLAWYLLAAMAVMAAAAALYPYSVAGEFYGRFIARGTAGYPVVIAFFSAVTAAALGMLATAAAKLSWARKRVSRRKPLWLATAGISAVVIALIAWSQPHAWSKAPTLSQPHVVLIGIDSLRREATTIAGDGKLTPNISAFLDKSLIFTDATTPLARTFPSWVSILSGRHPRSTGALVNLIDDKHIHAAPTLPQILQSNHYNTVFGMDEVRFANIDESYGFDTVITPPMGASDFLLATINDTPLGNLVINTPVGRWLFPNSYANRAASAVYDPNRFSARIEKEVDFSRPTFLAVHFTLPHWPYVWADAPLASDDEPYVSSAKYEAAVRRADLQFAHVMRTLESRGVLRNAIVIVLSDHGESLNAPEEILLPLDKRYTVQGAVTPMGAFGHGTSIFTPTQFSVVLGMRGFGAAPLAQLSTRRIGEPVSVEDIAPTVLDLVGKKPPEVVFDGRSLAGLIESPATASPSFGLRVRFTETEFNPPQLTAGANAERVIAAKNAKYYRVDPGSGRLEIKDDRLNAVLAGRQFAAIGARRLLAAFPSGTDRTYKFLLIDRTGENMQVFDMPPRTIDDPENLALWQGMKRRFASAIPADLTGVPDAMSASGLSSSGNQH